MKSALFPIGALILCSLQSIHAQEVEAGNLKIINLAALDSPTTLHLNATPLNSGEAIPFGDDTGTLTRIPNTYRLTIKNELAQPPSATFEINIKNRSHIVCATYCDLITRPNGKTTIKLRLAQFDESLADPGPCMTIISLVDHHPITIEANESSIQLRRLRPTPVSFPLETPFIVRSHHRKLAQLRVKHPAHFVAFLHRTPPSNKLNLSWVKNRSLPTLKSTNNSPKPPENSTSSPP